MIDKSTTTTGTSQQYPTQSVQYSAPQDTTGYTSGQGQAQTFVANQDSLQNYGIDSQSSSVPIASNIGTQTDTATAQQSQQNSAMPGYLPNYTGDQYTDPQRIQETQQLNSEFYQSIGGEPSYPGGVTPSASTTNTVTSTVQPQQQPASGLVSAGAGYGYTAYSSPSITYGTLTGNTGISYYGLAYNPPSVSNTYNPLGYTVASTDYSTPNEIYPVTATAAPMYETSSPITTTTPQITATSVAPTYLSTQPNYIAGQPYYNQQGQQIGTYGYNPNLSPASFTTTATSLGTTSLNSISVSDFGDITAQPLYTTATGLYGNDMTGASVTATPISTYTDAYTAQNYYPSTLSSTANPVYSTSGYSGANSFLDSTATTTSLPFHSVMSSYNTLTSSDTANQETSDYRDLTGATFNEQQLYNTTPYTTVASDGTSSGSVSLAVADSSMTGSVSNTVNPTISTLNPANVPSTINSIDATGVSSVTTTANPEALTDSEIVLAPELVSTPIFSTNYAKRSVN
uniref:Protein-tyrosine-phosphatase n=1 Tax=Syphacia muris TaxID=451379 RepID=A0A0N5AFQ3_9BILA